MDKLYRVIKQIWIFQENQKVSKSKLLEIFNPNFLQNTDYFVEIVPYIPKPNSNIELSEILLITERIIQEINNWEYPDDNMSGYKDEIYEYVFKSIYWRNVLNWINSKTLPF
jgi:hypothetical protein